MGPQGGTIVWGAIGICAWFAVQFAVIIAVIAWRNTVEPGSADAIASTEQQSPVPACISARARRCGAWGSVGDDRAVDANHGGCS